MERKYVDLSSNVAERRSAFSVYTAYRRNEAAYGHVNAGIYDVIGESGQSRMVTMETDNHDYVMSWLTKVDSERLMCEVSGSGSQ